ncbi:MAG: DNA-3-methyladenine glycosylase I [Bacilli bacterium]|jgi:DNA-3-methyladenine glycosylase I|nr:DNA-3-methyladenine glycosylase I [Bacilli bacterium]
MERCKWCKLNNPIYVAYHDLEWGVLRLDDPYLLEMLILESFQAGLSWECILNKRLDFQKAYDFFDLDQIIHYDEQKIQELLFHSKIIRNRLKIYASIQNAKIFKQIQNEFGSFSNYLLTFTKNQIFYEIGNVTNILSDNLSADLKKRGMKFVGSTIIYSFLQAIGIIYSHEKDCYLYQNKSN